MGSPRWGIRQDKRKQEELVTEVYSTTLLRLLCSCYYYSTSFVSHLQTKKKSPRILAWEDGFCNFAATSAACGDGAAAAYAAAECEETKQVGVAGGGLQPELFFKMSHDIYNYGEGYVYVSKLRNKQVMVINRWR